MTNQEQWEKERRELIIQLQTIQLQRATATYIQDQVQFELNKTALELSQTKEAFRRLYTACQNIPGARGRKHLNS